MKCYNKNYTNRHHIMSSHHLKRVIVGEGKKGNTQPCCIALLLRATLGQSQGY